MDKFNETIIVLAIVAEALIIWDYLNVRFFIGVSLLTLSFLPFLLYLIAMLRYKFIIKNKTNCLESYRENKIALILGFIFTMPTNLWVLIISLISMFRLLRVK